MPAGTDLNNQRSFGHVNAPNSQGGNNRRRYANVASETRKVAPKTSTAANSNPVAIKPPKNPGSNNYTSGGAGGKSAEQSLSAMSDHKEISSKRNSGGDYKNNASTPNGPKNSGKPMSNSSDAA